MKICFIASTYPRHPKDGAGRFVRSIAEALTDQGHTVHVVAPYHPSVAAIESNVQVYHFRYIWPDRWGIMGYAQAMDSDRRLRWSSYLLSPLFCLAEMAMLQRLMMRHRYDVLHAHWVIPNAFVAAWVAQLWKVPLVISTHGSDIFVAQKQAPLRALARWTLVHADAVSACSPHLYQGAQKLGADPQRLHLIPWGADIERFARTNTDESLRNRLSLTTEQPMILSLGRLVRKKGIAVMVRAMPAILQQHPDAVCLIVGDGPERSALQSLALDLGVADHVRFEGDIPWDDVPDYLNLCTLFVVPSIHDEDGNVDGMPTTILEAMAAGRPVIGSNVAGIPLVVDHEQTGLIIPEGDSVALAQAVNRLLATPDLCYRYGETAQLRVAQTLNWQRVARDFVDLYTEGQVRHEKGIA